MAGQCNYVHEQATFHRGGGGGGGRPAAHGKDYIHESSFFMSANRPYRSEFTISPEWISEEKTKQQKTVVPTRKSFTVHPEWVSEQAPPSDATQAAMRMTEAERY